MQSFPTHQRFTSIREFQLVSQIGSGSFGVVKLARHRTTARLYAVKVIQSVPSETEAKLLEREIVLHSQVDHPHLIRLWDTLMEEGVIYMVMELAEGGNLFYHQNTKATFSEPEAFRFFIQTLQGVEYLHRNDIIHRDLKPENLLLDACANIKICDFGWAAQNITLQRNTFCGTYQYMAPEMLFQNSYDHRVDVWALGILLYELLHGQAPFKGSNSAEVQQSMLKGGFAISPKLSGKVKDLMMGILQLDIQKRLSLAAIRSHPWVKDMEEQINAHLDCQKVRSPKEIYPSVSGLKGVKESIHRKNSSLNLEREGSFGRESGVLRKKGHKMCTLQKENKREPKEYLQHSQSGLLKRNKMEGIKTQPNETDLQRLLAKLKSKKGAKNGKDLASFQKEEEEHPFLEVTNKRKSKNNNSEADLLAQKYPIRFHTEAGELEAEPTRLKKNHLNAKLLHFSRNLARTQKGRLQPNF